EQALTRLVADIDARALTNLTATARASLRDALLKELCDLAAPALYERFAAARKERAAAGAAPPSDGDTAHYAGFIAEMRGGGLHRLFEDKPVLLRLIATMTRQWIDTSREFITRLDADLASIRSDILRCYAGRVTAIEGD